MWCLCSSLGCNLACWYWRVVESCPEVNRSCSGTRNARYELLHVDVLEQAEHFYSQDIMGNLDICKNNMLVYIAVRLSGRQESLPFLLECPTH